MAIGVRSLVRLRGCAGDTLALEYVPHVKEDALFGFSFLRCRISYSISIPWWPVMLKHSQPKLTRYYLG
jgi:hypothetical protein